MRKVLVFVAIFGLLLPSSAAVSVDAPAAIAVIDNGTNSSLFKDSIVTEVCVLNSYKCPNGKTFMEGAGAANLPATTNKDFNHGTQMISIIARVNPAAKIISIRIVGMTAAGNPGLYNLDDVKAALDWIIANQTKYNIAVVSLAQGKIFPNCKVPAGMPEQIAKLKALNVALIAAVGNDGNHTSVMSPACLPDAIAAGATDNPYPGVQPIPYDVKGVPYIARYSNGATGQTDFFLNARWYVKQLDGSMKFTVGTSNATAALAGYWLANRKASVDETYAGILATTTDIKNEFQTGKFIVIDSIPLGNCK